MLAPALLGLAVFALLGLYFVPDEFFGGGGRARLPCVGPNCARPSMRPIHPAVGNPEKSNPDDLDGYVESKERQRQAKAEAQRRAMSPHLYAEKTSAAAATEDVGADSALSGHSANGSDGK